MEFRELDPASKREVNHLSQLMDVKNEMFQFNKLKGAHNSFVTGICWNDILVSRPFEETLNESISDVMQAITQEYQIDSRRRNGRDKVTFIGWEDDAFDNEYKHINFTTGERKLRIYQTPKSLEELTAKKKKKFKKLPYTWRELDNNDYKQIKEVATQWRENKIASQDGRTKQRDIRESTQHSIPSYDNVVRNDNRELVTMYGAFLEGQLVAYTQTSGNQHIHSIDRRAHIPTGMRSAQEYLDYNVFIELAKKEIPLVDRGVVGNRETSQGLLDYKRKFGNLTGRYEVIYSGVHTREWNDEKIQLN